MSAVLRCWLVFGVFLSSVVSSQAEPRTYRERLEPHWIKGEAKFWYRNDNPGGEREFFLVDAESGEKRPAFDHKKIDPKTIEKLEFDQQLLKAVGRSKTWTIDRESGEIRENEGKAEPTGLPSGNLIRPSRGGGPETNIIFKNALQIRVELVWIDPSGNKRSYGFLEAGEERDQHTFAGHVWAIFDDEKRLRGVFEGRRGGGIARIAGPPKVPPPNKKPAPKKAAEVDSPDKKWAAFVRDDQLWIRNEETAEETQLSKDANAKNSFRRSASRDRAMGMNYNKPDYPETLPEVWWSPDSKKLIAAQTTVVPEPRVHYLEVMPKTKLQSYPYFKAGDAIPEKTLRLFDLESKSEIEVDQQLLKNPWGYGHFRWERDSSRFIFLFNQRGHQALRLCAIDADSGELTALVDETSETFINYSNKTFLRFFDETREFIWMSERDGWNHLYLFDSDSGELKNQITKGEWVVRGVDKIDPDKRTIDFRVCGVREGEDPYHIHHCRVNFDGSDFTILTEGDGTHEIHWSPDRRFFVDTWSRVDLPPVHVLRDAEGKLVVELETCDASEIELLPIRFTAKGRDGETDIHGIIHLPGNMAPSTQYPVVECIYAGPHGQHVPKSFRSRYRHQRQIADRGFFVVQIDGMGTNWRSKEFLDVAWRNLGDAGFPDRIAWIRAAAEKWGAMDISRVGIYGGSAGGQNAAGAVMRHGDFYKAAVADCGCHDNRMDKIWWSEAWMGWPVGDHYAESSNVDQAHRLNSELLLIVGGKDRNVDPASTMQVAAALIKADKDFDLLVIPEAGHGAAETAYGSRRRVEFFVEHLITRRKDPEVPEKIHLLEPHPSR